MKFIHLRGFEKHLEGIDPAHCSLVYTIVGKEPFERKIALEALLKKLYPNHNDRAFGLRIYDCGQINLPTLMDALNGLTLFSGRQVLVLNDAEKLDKNLTAALERYFRAPNSSTCLILSAATINKNTTLYKKAEKVGIVLDLVDEKSKDKESSAQQWITSFLASEKKSIDGKALRLLIYLVGCETSKLHSELEKLICFCGERSSIREQDVLQTITAVNHESVFQLSDAIFRRDTASALRIGCGMLQEGTSFFALLRMIRSQFQVELQIASILANGGDVQEITHHYPYIKGYILEKHITTVQSYGYNSLKKAVMAIDSCELQAKNGNHDSDLLAELLLLKLTTR